MVKKLKKKKKKRGIFSLLLRRARTLAELCAQPARASRRGSAPPVRTGCSVCGCVFKASACVTRRGACRNPELMHQTPDRKPGERSASPVTLGSRLVLHCGTNTVMFRLPSFQKYSTAIAIPRQEKNFFRPWLQEERQSARQCNVCPKSVRLHREKAKSVHNRNDHHKTLSHTLSLFGALKAPRPRQNLLEGT